MTAAFAWKERSHCARSTARARDERSAPGYSYRLEVAADSAAEAEVDYSSLTNRGAGGSEPAHGPLASCGIWSVSESRVPTPDTTRVSGRRFVAHVVDGTLFYFIALIGMLTSDYRQRLGDRWGGTYVVAD
jgi:hypothetical protein